MSSKPPITIEDVRDAAARLEGVAHRTPVLGSPALDARVGAEVLLKCENLQRIGAFKFRGAYNAISRLAADAARRAASPPTPRATTPRRSRSRPAAARQPRGDRDAGRRTRVEARRDRGYGAEIVTYDRYTDDRVAIGRRARRASAGLTLIPPYEHPDVIAGQGTAALELIEEAGDARRARRPGRRRRADRRLRDVATALQPRHRVVGVEPEAGDDTRRSLAAGERVSIPVPRTDRRRPGRADVPGELTFSINRGLVDEIVLVSDDEIVAAMALPLRPAEARRRAERRDRGGGAARGPARLRCRPHRRDRLRRQHRQRAVSLAARRAPGRRSRSPLADQQAGDDRRRCAEQRTGSRTGRGRQPRCGPAWNRVRPTTWAMLISAIAPAIRIRADCEERPPSSPARSSLPVGGKDDERRSCRRSRRRSRAGREG